VAESNKVYCWLQNINILPPSEVKLPENIGNIISIKSGNTSTIFLTDKKTVYKIDYALD
jgi:hypothetical protein